MQEHKEKQGELDDFEALLSSAINEEGEPDLEALFKDVQDGDISQEVADAVMSADKIEALLREQWSLPKLDLSGEINRADALYRSGGEIKDDPFAADDYTDEQSEIVKALKKPCLKAIDPSAKEKDRDDAIRWIFEVGAKEKHGMTFEATCRALGARGFVVQALIQHFWFLRGIVISELPYLSRPLSEILEQEAIIHGMEPGLNLARTVWKNPSIHREKLLLKVAGDDQEKLAEHARVLDRLYEEGLLAERMGMVYFTSRHPEKRHRANKLQGKVRGVSWSQSFVGDIDE